MNFDIAIIGGGPGGYNAAEKAAKLGMQVVLFEKEDLGGTCLNRGCMPTKALIHSTELYESLAHAKEMGVNVGEVSFDFAAMHARKTQVVEELRKGVEKLMKAGKITAVIIDNEPAKSFVAANEGLKILEGAYADEDYAIAVGKEDTELLEKINKALAELKADGTLDQIVNKYIPAE